MFFPAHTLRVLSIASASADQTIRIWHCFAVEKKKAAPKAKRESMNVAARTAAVFMQVEHENSYAKDDSRVLL